MLGLLQVGSPLIELLPQSVQTIELIVGGLDLGKRVALLLLDLRELADQLLLERASPVQLLMQALDGLPADWSDGSSTKTHMTEAVLFANLFCAQAHPSGSSLSAGSLVPAFKPDGEIGKLLRELGAAPDGVGPSGKAH